MYVYQPPYAVMRLFAALTLALAARVWYNPFVLFRVRQKKGAPCRAQRRPHKTAVNFCGRSVRSPPPAVKEWRPLKCALALCALLNVHSLAVRGDVLSNKITGAFFASAGGEV